MTTKTLDKDALTVLRLVEARPMKIYTNLPGMAMAYAIQLCHCGYLERCYKNTKCFRDDYYQLSERGKELLSKNKGVR